VAGDSIGIVAQTLSKGSHLFVLGYKQFTLLIDSPKIQTTSGKSSETRSSNLVYTSFSNLISFPFPQTYYEGKILPCISLFSLRS